MWDLRSKILTSFLAYFECWNNCWKSLKAQSVPCRGSMRGAELRCYLYFRRHNRRHRIWLVLLQEQVAVLVYAVYCCGG